MCPKSLTNRDSPPKNKDLRVSQPRTGRVLEITTRIGCKNNCSYCPQDTLIRAYSVKNADSELSFDTLRKCLETVPTNVSIHFSGFSEPFLNADCSRLILHAHERGHSIRVYTTMVGMRLFDISVLRAIPFERFVIHLPDSGSKTRIKVDDASLNLLKALLSGGIRNLSGVSVGTDGPGGIHPQIRAAIEKAGICIEYPALTTRAGNIDKSAIRIQPKICGPIGLCDRLYRNVLLPNGDVALCCADYGLRHVLGNLLMSNYESIFEGDEFLSITKELLDDSHDVLCRHCEWAPAKRKGAGAVFRKIRSFFGIRRKSFPLHGKRE